MGGVVAAGCSGLAGLAFVVWWVRRAWRHTAIGVVHALRRRDELSVRVLWLEATGGTWNPAKPLGVDNPLFEAGRGTYRLRGSDEVVLDWHPAAGSPQEYRGAIPDRLKNKHDPERRRHRKLLRLFIGVEVAAIVIGFGVGFAAATGRTAERFGFGLLGVFGGMVAVWLLTLIANVARGVRGSLGSTEQDSRSPK